MGLLPRRGNRVEGEATFEGTNLLALDEKAMRERRGRDIAMIFQDPLSSLNPVVPVGLQVTEVLERHRGMSRKAAQPVARDLLKRVGIPDPDRRLKDYPHQMSGGMRQRALIAMALACNAAAAHRRRADDRARRHDPGADPRPAQGARAGDRHGARHDHPRPRRRRRPVRRGQRPVRRPHRRARRAPRAVRRPPPPVHQRPARVDPDASTPRAASGSPRSPGRSPTTCRGRTPARSPPAAPTPSRSAWSRPRSSRRPLAGPCAASTP